MKLATLKNGCLDGQLVLVNSALTHMLILQGINEIPNIPNLQHLLDNWLSLIDSVKLIYAKFNQINFFQYQKDKIVEAQGSNSKKITIPSANIIPYNPKLLTSPLPRAYQWLDGSAYLHHVELVRKARKAEMPEVLYYDPLMYQGCSDRFLAPTDNIEFPTIDDAKNLGIDFEAEIAVVTDYVPMGTKTEEAGKHIRLVMLANDISLRNLIPEELAKGFGFIVSKPAGSFSPIAVTIDELGNHWNMSEYKLDLPIYSYLNGNLFGKPNAGIDLQFNFAKLIAHASKTRSLTAGTIIGSGTVSNRDLSVGSSCLAEKRMLEIIKNGTATTPFLQDGDNIKIEMLDHAGNNIFGSIEQKVIIK